MTEDYEYNNRSKNLKELFDYASKEYSFHIREIALSYLIDLQIYNQPILESLVNAAVHHNWRFRNFARNHLKALVDDPAVLVVLKSSMSSFNQKEQEYLKREILK
jgi:aminopeptidase N